MKSAGQLVCFFISTFTSNIFTVVKQQASKKNYMPRTDNFQKFVKQKKAGTVKEEIRQEKKKEKKERAAAIEAHFERKRAERLQKQQPRPTEAKVSRPNKYPQNVATASTLKTFRTDNSSTKPTPTTVAKKDNEKTAAEQMPLNKYIAHGGLCSRRDAALLVRDGKVTVNGATVTDPGTKISEKDAVKVGNKRITPTKNFVYILLNKPKDFITTSEDPQGRKTVVDLVRTATDERVYPVGRLDRNTSGVLLLTNDGELAQKLSHPSHEVKKVYEVKLDRALTKADIDTIASGLTLEDGFVAPDVVAYADAKDKSVIGVEIHSGRNRIVRRIFEHLKYDVKGLDRVMYAGLTKKDVQRGRWRFLKEKEVRLLKFMNQSFVKVKE